jgi:hypothetical protein
MRAWHLRRKIVEEIWSDVGMRIGAAHRRLVGSTRLHQRSLDTARSVESLMHSPLEQEMHLAALPPLSLLLLRLTFQSRHHKTDLVMLVRNNILTRMWLLVITAGTQARNHTDLKHTDVHLLWCQRLGPLHPQ